MNATQRDLTRKGLFTVKNKFPLVMKLTAIVTAAATILLTALYLQFAHSGLLTAAISVGTTCYHFSMRLMIGTLVPIIKRNHSWFNQQKWEFGLYRFLRVKSWKKHLPIYDPRQFSLEENTLEQVIWNMRRAEVVHCMIALFSFLPLLSVPFLGAFPVFLITSLLAAMFDSLFIIVQRYNRPRLERIFKKKGVGPY